MIHHRPTSARVTKPRVDARGCSRLRPLLAALAFGAVFQSLAIAQTLAPATTPATASATTPATTPAQKPPAREPTLDELLGIKPVSPGTPLTPADTGPVTPSDGPARDAREALDRDLSEADVDEAFAQAVALMGQTAARLGGGADGARDAGIDTQRLQEDILRKLDALIDAAEKNAQQSQSKSRQKKRSREQQEGQQQGQQSSQVQAQQQQQGQRSGTDAGGVPGQAAAPGTALGGSTASWGNLPQHVRDALTEGTSDRFSSMYRAMTEEYYKRLAEDRSGTTPRERRP